MFHAALWKLIRLQWRGGFRQLGRSLKTVRGLFHFAFMLALTAWGFSSMYFFGRASSQALQVTASLSAGLTNVLTFGLFAYTCYAVLFSTGEALVYFTPSEVAFLFPAPLTRKQLLSYKLLKSLFGIIALSVFMPLFFARSLVMVGTGFVGVTLTVSFLQLLTMDVAFLRQVLQEKVHVLLRRLFGYFLSLLLVAAVVQTTQSAPNADLVTLAQTFQQTTAGTWMLAPFQVFVRLLQAEDFLSFLSSAGIVFLIDLLLLLLAYRLDALSLEAALATSEKLTARLKLVQAKGVWHLLGSANAQVVQRRIPHLPFWAGVGPVVWQKMTTNFRASTKLLWMLGGAVVFAGCLVFGIHRSHPEAPGAPIAGMAVMGYLSLLISLSQQNEIERAGYLKSLPIRSVSIVIGELLGFIVLLSAVQSAFFLVVAGFFPSFTLWLLCGAVFTLPWNFQLFAIDKLVFYLYPTRLVKGTPGDFQNAGRQMIFIFFKMLILGAAATIVGVSTIPAALIFQSPLGAVASAGITLCGVCAALIPLLVFAFDRFDPSVDMPA